MHCGVSSVKCEVQSVEGVKCKLECKCRMWSVKRRLWSALGKV